MSTKRLLEGIEGYLGKEQAQCLLDLAQNSEEKAYFVEMIDKLSKHIDQMPVTYETDEQGMQALAQLHYFKGCMDWWITEKDIEGRTQAFGWADLGSGGELGYINIDSLTQNGVELDLYWTPKPLADVIGPHGCH